MERYLTVNEVAHRLNLSRWKIYAEITAGRLAAVRVTDRGDYRVTEDALMEWLGSRSPAA
jgi:excisionase family DNA binding protein